MLWCRLPISAVFESCFRLFSKLLVPAASNRAINAREALVVSTIDLPSPPQQLSLSLSLFALDGCTQLLARPFSQDTKGIEATEMVTVTFNFLRSRFCKPRERSFFGRGFVFGSCDLWASTHTTNTATKTKRRTAEKRRAIIHHSLRRWLMPTEENRERVDHTHQCLVASLTVSFFLTTVTSQPISFHWCDTQHFWAI